MSLENLQKVEVASVPGFTTAEAHSESWRTLVARPRIEASTIEELREWVIDELERGQKWLVLDLRGTRFISLPAIAYLESLATDLRNVGGALAFLGMPDRVHRLFEIYGSLKKIHLVDKSESLAAVHAKILSPLFRLGRA